MTTYGVPASAQASAAMTVGGVEASPRWQVSRLVWRLAAAGILAVLGGLVAGRPEPIVVAVPCLVAVVVALRQPRPERVVVTATVSELRAFEDDPVEVEVQVRAPFVLGEIALDLALPRVPERSAPAVETGGGAGPGGTASVDGGDSDRAASGVDRQSSRTSEQRRTRRGSTYFGIEGERGRHRFGVAQVTETWTVRAHRWGRWRLGPLHLRLRTSGWGYVGRVALTLTELTVFPPPGRARDIAVPPMLLARVGSHVARRAGSGVEFAGIRSFAPGDAVRRINWAASTRRGEPGELFVNEFAAERAADIVAVVDTTVDVGTPGRSSLDIGVRGAAAVVQAYLRYADRVGLVALGGTLRWLSPDVGIRQYYRIVETLLSSRLDNSFLEPELAHLPPQALPPGALAFVFTPLLDPRAVEAIRDLRERGHPVVLIDVLTGEPPVGPVERVGRHRVREQRLAQRIWRLEREALVHRLQAIGVTVLEWDEESGVPLDRVRLEPMLRGGR
ncbi:DUF58 domain-containing protein [Actinopolymorpha sp. B17G11]|uniref:DUF58 domain-containing protein n=1 Tax=Actinopolymorpha sp. B17G11 TaxID=3160861 RepID=UPI0032E46B27